MSNNTPPDNSLTRLAGLYVSKGSVWFVVVLMVLMFFLAHHNYRVIDEFGVAGQIGNGQYACTSELCLRYALESEHLQMQTAKVGMVTFHRFILSSIAFIVSLVTIVLGSVLVFDRVRAATADNVALSYKDYFFSFGSTFPGSLMVLLGSVTLGLNLFFAGPGSPRVYAETHPLFLPDVNYQLHRFLGRANAFGTNISPEQLSAAQTARAFNPANDTKNAATSSQSGDLRLEGERPEDVPQPIFEGEN